MYQADKINGIAQGERMSIVSRPPILDVLTTGLLRQLNGPHVSNSDIGGPIIIQSLSVTSSTITLVWSGSGVATIKIFASITPNGSSPTEIYSAGGQTAGTYTWVVNSVDVVLSYFSTLTYGDTTLTSDIVRSSNTILTPFNPGYDIIVIAGQSNGMGFGEGGQNSVNHPNVYELPVDPSDPPELVSGNTVAASPNILYESNGTQRSDGAVITLSDAVGVGQNMLFRGEGLGKCFGIDFANQYAQIGLLHPGRRVLLVQTCIGSVSFTAVAGLQTDNNGKGWWNGSTLPLGLGTQNLIWKVSKALEKKYIVSGSTLSKATNNRLIALCWQEGESESNIPGPSGLAIAENYKENLRSFYNSCINGIQSNLTSLGGFTPTQATSMLETRTLLVGAMTLPFIADTNNNAAVVTARAENVNTSSFGDPVPRSAYVSSVGTTTTDIHFNFNDLDILSTRYLGQYYQIAATPPPVPDLVVSITSFFINGKTFTVKWNDSTNNLVLRLFNNGPNNSINGGVQVGANINISSGTSEFTSSALDLIPNDFYYCTITQSLSTNTVIAVSQPFPVATLQVAYSGTTITDISPSNRSFKALRSPGGQLDETPKTDTRIIGLTSRTVFSAPFQIGSVEQPQRWVSISGEFGPGSYTKTGWVKYEVINGSTYPHILSGCQNGVADGCLHLFWIFNGSSSKNITAVNTYTSQGRYHLGVDAKDISIQTGRWYFAATVYDSTLGDNGSQTMYVYDETDDDESKLWIKRYETPGPDVGLDSQGVALREGRNPGIIPSALTSAEMAAGLIPSFNYSLFMGGFSKAESTFTGQLDDVRLYNRALTPQQIVAIRDSISA
jgi:hypothetical protein